MFFKSLIINFIVVVIVILWKSDIVKIRMKNSMYFIESIELKLFESFKKFKVRIIIIIIVCLVVYVFLE